MCVRACVRARDCVSLWIRHSKHICNMRETFLKYMMYSAYVHVTVKFWFNHFFAFPIDDIQTVV